MLNKLKSIKTKALLAVPAVSAALASVPVIVRANEPASLETSFTTALNTVKSDFMTYAGAALPVALSIAGIVLAISLGWKLFKKFTGR